MKKPTQTQIISILIIFALSDGKTLTTMDLISKLDYDDWFSENFSIVMYEYKKNCVINDTSVSRALKCLVKKCIIKRETGEPNKGGAKPNLCMLIKDPETLFFIIKLFKENNFTEHFQKHFLNEICQSAYCKELTNWKLVYRLNDLKRIKYHSPPNITDDEFKNNVLLTENELQYIIRIINISPNALFKVLSLLYDPEYYIGFYYQSNVSSNHIINEVIFGLLLDLKNNIPLEYPVYYNIEVILGDEPISKDEYIKMDLDSYCDENMIVSVNKSFIYEL